MRDVCVYARAPTCSVYVLNSACSFLILVHLVKIRYRILTLRNDKFFERFFEIRAIDVFHFACIYGWCTSFLAGNKRNATYSKISFR